MKSPHLPQEIPQVLTLEQLEVKKNRFRQMLGHETRLSQAETFSLAAEDYIDRGFAVLPLYPPNGNSCSCGTNCASPGKHPRTRRGVHDGSKIIENIRAWWQESPLCPNLGIVTGITSNLVVVDVDTHRGGDIAALVSEIDIDIFHSTLCVQTGSGGWHFYFLHPGNTVKNRTNVIPGIDVRGDGGFVVAPPSLHVSGKHYRWANNHPIQPLPEPLLEILATKGRNHDHQNNSNSKVGAFAQGCRNDSLTRIGGFLRHMGVCKESLIGALEQMNLSLCEPPLAAEEVKKVALSVSRYTPSEPWPEPQPLQTARSKAESLMSAHLPQSLRPALTDLAERLQVPLEFVAAPTIIGLAATIGRKFKVCPLSVDPWEVTPNLWGMIIAEPGTLKSPSFTQALLPLQRLIQLARKDHSDRVEAFEREQIAREVRIQALRELLKKQNKKGGIEKELTNLLLAAKTAKRPTERRYLTNDPTVEKLADILVDNTNGLLVFRDELSGWLEILAKSGREGSREFYLEGWNGDGSFTVDRIGRGTVFVQYLCLSIFGGMQPTKIRQYIEGIDKQGGDDGLLERFQLLFYPEDRPDWRLIDRPPDYEAQTALTDLFIDLDRLSEKEVGLRFSSESQELADAWRCELEVQLANQELNPTIRSHYSKYRSLMPSLALIFQLCDKLECTEIGLASTKLAIDWCQVLRSHALKVYDPLQTANMQGANRIAELIRQKKIHNGMKFREIARKNWLGLKTSGQIEDACNALEGLNWLRIIRQKTMGKETSYIQLNPNIARLGGDL